MVMLRIDINCDNAAFEDNLTYEVSRILEDIKLKLHGCDDITLRDHNGNRVGSATWLTTTRNWRGKKRKLKINKGETHDQE